MAEPDFQAWLFPSTSCHQDLVRFGVDKASRAETEWVGRVLVGTSKDSFQCILGAQRATANLTGCHAAGSHTIN